MAKSISKAELVKLISETTTEVCEANQQLLENQLDGTIKISVNIASYVTIKILDKLDVVTLD